MQQNITRKTVKEALPRPQRYIVFDAAVRGFGLRVLPSGEKRWIFEYRPHPGGRVTPKKLATIGSTKEFSPDEARKLADKLRAMVKMGEDPQAATRAERDSITVEQLAQEFLERHVSKKRSPATFAAYTDVVDRYIVPEFGKVKAKSLTGAQVSRWHQRLEASPYAANKALAVLSAIYGWASGPPALVPSGTNPAKGIERFNEVKRGRVLSTDELARLGAAIRTAEVDGVPWQVRDSAKTKHLRKNVAERKTRISPHAAAAIRLLILTGMRLREVLSLRWSQIDFDRGVIVLEKHKTARTTGSKAVVLNAPALAVLDGIDRIGAYVVAGEFAGTKDEQPRPDLKRPWAVVRSAAGLDDLRIHDLRHNFGGFGASGGLGLPIIGKLLGHTQPATTSRYSHLDADPVRKASDAIGERLLDALGERPKDTSADIVPIKRGV
ncbi:MAG TPA: tyrosine-type recombinase/integrase [Devosia sp.]|nr:tyrosine-type recombinase/integrase [Devosia sp.]